DAKQWERFVGVAKSGAEQRKEYLAPLTRASGFWSIEKVQHYRWAFMSLGYCKVLGTAASRNPSWEEAVVKLNQLLFRRIAKGLRASINPVIRNDLEHLCDWRDTSDFTKTGKNGFTVQCKPISSLPEGYTFDRYGLI
ncbi:hypothetical protein K469DRAFT_490957, partial [Zopfia rhizophila CBS 207.26]